MSNIKQSRQELKKEDIELCHKLIDELAVLYNETHPNHGKESEKDKKQKSEIALQKLALVGSILTEWAECQIFGTYYQISKSPTQWIDTEMSNSHENETMWYQQDFPEDFFVGQGSLESERAAIAQILQNSFKRYFGRKL